MVCLFITDDNSDGATCSDGASAANRTFEARNVAAAAPGLRLPLKRRR